MLTEAQLLSNLQRNKNTIRAAINNLDDLIEFVRTSSDVDYSHFNTWFICVRPNGVMPPARQRGFITARDIFIEEFTEVREVYALQLLNL